MHVLVLVGVPGAGKTSLSKRLASSGWLHINQDELGSRRACEDAFRTALRRYQHVVVDRCNIDESQRVHWVRMALEARSRGINLVALQLLLPLELCKERARGRSGHPTLGPHNCDEVIDRFALEFVPVRPREGFHCVVTARSSPEAEAAVEQLLAEASSHGNSPLGDPHPLPHPQPYWDPSQQPYDSGGGGSGPYRRQLCTEPCSVPDYQYDSGRAGSSELSCHHHQRQDHHRSREQGLPGGQPTLGRGRGGREVGGRGSSWKSHQQVVKRLRATFADPRSTTPYDLLPSELPGPPGLDGTAANATMADTDAAVADPRVILLFDLNGTLTSHTSVRKAQGTTRLRPGTEHLVALKRHFRLGIYTSSTVRTVQAAMEQLEQAAGQQLFERRLVLHREHTMPAPQNHVDAGGDPWDTLKPLGRYFSALHRIILVDDDAYKSIKGEESSMLVVPCWRDEDAACCVLRLLSEALLSTVAPLPPDADVRAWTARVSADLHARAA